MNNIICWKQQPYNTAFASLHWLRTCLGKKNTCNYHKNDEYLYNNQRVETIYRWLGACRVALQPWKRKSNQFSRWSRNGRSMRRVFISYMRIVIPPLTPMLLQLRGWCCWHQRWQVDINFASNTSESSVHVILTLFGMLGTHEEVSVLIFVSMVSYLK